VQKQRAAYPFRITAIHTATRGSAFDDKGLPIDPFFGPGASSVGEFLDRARPEVAIEITTLNPERGEPAITHIRKAFARGVHVITANKGPIAHAYALLRDEAKQAQVEFRFESTVMDGAPVFNNIRNNLPGIKILGFTGVLNSTSKVVIAAMQRGLTAAEGIREAQAMGIAEVNASYDIDGWDSAAKTAALANVLMDARITPHQVERQGIGDLTTERAVKLRQTGKTVLLVSRAQRYGENLHLSVQPEIVPEAAPLAAAKGTSNTILLHTDLLGTIGIVSLNPGVEQTAYGIFADLVDIAKSL
jgi:homoserine dehydrogenase